MSDFRIVANNVELDIFDDVGISLNYNFNDIKNSLKIGTNFSKTITLPSTVTNDNLFNKIYNINVSNSIGGNIVFNPLESIKTEIYKGSELVLEGYMQLLSVSNDNDVIKYNVTIKSDLVNLFDGLKGKKINNILQPFYRQYTHTRNLENVKSNIENGMYMLGGEAYSSILAPYKYSINPITLAKGLYNKFTVEGATSGDTYTNNLNYSYIGYMVPQIRVKDMFEQTFNYLGVELEFDSDEIDELYVLTANNFRKQGNELINSNFRADTVTSANDYEFSYPVSFDESSTANTLTFNEITNGDDAVMGFNEITILESGNYNIKGVIPQQLDFTATVGSISSFWIGKLDPFYFRWRWELYVERDGNEVVIIDYRKDAENANYLEQRINRVRSSNVVTFNDSEFDIILDEKNIELVKGDVIKIRTSVTDDGWGPIPFTVNGGAFYDVRNVNINLKTNLTALTSSIILEPYGDYQVGTADEVNIDTLLPNMDAKNFIDSVRNMFKLMFIPNGDKVKVISYENFISKNKKIIDLEESNDIQIDYSNTIDIKPMSEIDVNEYSFFYKKDKDIMNNNEEEDLYGGYSFQINNSFSKKSQDVKIGLTPTQENSVRDNLITNNTNGWSIEKQKETNEYEVLDTFNPRIGYVSQNHQSVDGINNLVIGNNNTQNIDDNTFTYSATSDSIVSVISPSFMFSNIKFNESNNSARIEDSCVFKWGYANDSDEAASVLYKNNSGINSAVGDYELEVNYNCGLFDKYYKRDFNTITNINATLLSATAYITPSFIKNLNWANVYYYRGAHWLLNSVKDYSPNVNNLVKVEFVRYFDYENPTRLFDNNLLGTCNVDNVITVKNGLRYEYLTEDNKPLTKECCKVVGGEWSSEQNKCYVINDFGNDVITTSVQYNGEKSKNNDSKTGKSLFIGRNNKDLSNAGSLMVGDNNVSTAKNSIVVGDNLQSNRSNSITVQEAIIIKSGEVILGEDDSTGSYFSTTRAELLTMISNNELKIGTKYYFASQDDFIIAEATQNNLLSSNVTIVKLMVNPDVYNGTAPAVYKGVGIENNAYVVGDIVIWGNRLWECNTNTNLGFSDMYALDADWDLINREEDDYYEYGSFFAVYDIVNDVIYKIIDRQGNIFQTRENDYGMESMLYNDCETIINNNINSINGIKYNKALAIENNYMLIGSIRYNLVIGDIANNYDCTDIFGNTVDSIAGNNRCLISRNKNLGSISFNSAGTGIIDITDNINNGRIVNNTVVGVSNLTIDNNTNNGPIEYNNATTTILIQNNINNGYIGAIGGPAVNRGASISDTIVNK